MGALLCVSTSVLRGSAATPFATCRPRGRHDSACRSRPPRPWARPCITGLVWDRRRRRGSPRARWAGVCLHDRVYGGTAAPLQDGIVETCASRRRRSLRPPGRPTRGGRRACRLPRIRPIGNRGRRASGRVRTVSPMSFRIGRRAGAAPPSTCRSSPAACSTRVVTRIYYFADESTRTRPTPCCAPSRSTVVGPSSRNAPTTAITSASDCREMARLSSSTSEPSFDPCAGTVRSRSTAARLPMPRPPAGAHGCRRCSTSKPRWPWPARGSALVPEPAASIAQPAASSSTTSRRSPEERRLTPHASSSSCASSGRWSRLRRTAMCT